MTRRDYIFLFFIGFMVAAAIGFFQPVPGYMDADYYFMGGLRLAQGQGFTENILWNYLDAPRGLPHPAFAYWMPLASILAAAAMRITSTLAFASAKWIFIFTAACLPPMTAALAYSFTSKRTLTFASGLLAAFSGLYAPFLSTTDTFGLYMFFGALFLLVAQKLPGVRCAFLLGIVAALMHLSRADGALWLVFAGLFILMSFGLRQEFFINGLAIVTGYALFMIPWLSRNLGAFGALLAPGGNKALWLTTYNQLFAYPADALSFAVWKEAGIASIMEVRAWALGLNLQTAFGVQAGVLFLPFIIIGAWQLRKDKRVQLGIIAWFTTFIVMTMIFPFAGARGGFFHSGAATQALFWALTPIGLAAAVAWGARLRRWNVEQAQAVFRTGLVGLAILITGMVIYGRVIQNKWEGDSVRYRQVEALIQSNGAQPGDVVVVANPPGYFIYAERPAIALPDGNVGTLLALKEKFGARYVVLEVGSMPAGFEVVYDAGPAMSNLRYIGGWEDVRVFEIP
jgi:hypothetical protein